METSQSKTDESSKPNKLEVLAYQGYLARVVTAVSFACILGIMGFGFDRLSTNSLTLVLFCFSMPITLVMAMLINDPRRNYHMSKLMGLIYFLGLLLFAIAFIRLIGTHSPTAGWSLGVMTIAMMVIASQSQDRFTKLEKKKSKEPN